MRCGSTKRPAILGSNATRDGGNRGRTSCQSVGCGKPAGDRGVRGEGDWAFLKEGVDGAMSVDESLEKEK